MAKKHKKQTKENRKQKRKTCYAHHQRNKIEMNAAQVKAEFYDERNNNAVDYDDCISALFKNGKRFVCRYNGSFAAIAFFDPFYHNKIEQTIKSEQQHAKRAYYRMNKNIERSFKSEHFEIYAPNPAERNRYNKQQ